MWLLSTSTLDLHYFQDVGAVPYAILSHTWEEEEVSFQEMRANDRAKREKGYKKIEKCCQQARVDGYEYAWVDTCCIDKSSSAELSEAINSMFNWYQRAAVCYVFLSDVKWFNSTVTTREVHGCLYQSRWFTRGWTLQELLAPRTVRFFAQDWKELGTKIEFSQVLSEITRIDSSALMGQPLMAFNVAERMSWAACRETTRVEDVAYSLLGIFGINMPLLYGEGDQAFLRLQKQIIETTEDYTIFAFQASNSADSSTPLLAHSPGQFEPNGSSGWKYSDFLPKLDQLDDFEVNGRTSNHIPTLNPPAVTSRGIKMQALCSEYQVYANAELAPGHWDILLCPMKTPPQSWLTITVELQSKVDRTAMRYSAHPRVLQRRAAKIKDLYITISPAQLRDRESGSSDRCCQQLKHVMFESAQAIPSADATEVAHRLRNGAWCATCCAYAPRSHQCRQVSSVTALLGTARIGRAERHGDERDTSNFGTEADADFEVPFDDRPEVDPKLEANDKAETTLRLELDIQLFKLDRSLSNIYPHLPSALRRLIQCCCVAMSQARRIAHVPTSRAESHLASSFFDVLNLSLAMKPSLGYMALALGSYRSHVVAKKRIWEENCNDPAMLMEAYLLASIIACSRMLVLRSEEDRFAVEIAQASFMCNYKRVIETHLTSSSELGRVIGSFLQAEDILEQFILRMHGQPSIQEDPVKFVNWLRYGIESWGGYTTAGNLFSILEELAKICFIAEGRSQEQTNLSMSVAASILQWYTKGDEAQLSCIPVPRKYLGKQNSWQAIETEILDDFKLRGPPRVSVARPNVFRALLLLERLRNINPFGSFLLHILHIRR